MTLQASFAERLSLADAWAWLDAYRDAPASEPLPLPEALGRVLSAPLAFPEDRPDRELALIDGYALQAEFTLGADSYNPLSLTLVPKGAPVTAGSAIVCCAGEAVPPGADAVAPLDVGQATGAVVDFCAVVARGPVSRTKATRRAAATSRLRRAGDWRRRRSRSPPRSARRN